MSKYDPLRHFLLGFQHDEWRTSFTDIEKILGFRLPRSAHEYPAWWANERDPRSSHRNAWLKAGWHAEEPSLTAKRVVFRRAAARPQAAARQVGRSEARSADHPPGVAILAEPGLACALSLAWMPIGHVRLDASGKLVFPRGPSSPGLYRFTIDAAGGTTVYIGEADNLMRRFQHYRTPGPRQETNLRINALMRRALREGAQIGVATVTGAATVRMGEQERPADFTSKAERVLFEHAALLMSRASGVVLANK